MENVGWGDNKLPDGFISHYAAEMPEGLREEHASAGNS